MTSPSGLLGRWLLCGLVALGLALSGPAHHTWCNAHHGGGASSCCDAGNAGDSESPDDSAASAAQGEHACALCFIGAAPPPRGEDVAVEIFGGAVVRQPEVGSTPCRTLHSPERPRGPPALF